MKYIDLYIESEREDRLFLDNILAKYFEGDLTTDVKESRKWLEWEDWEDISFIIKEEP
jgi:hypothetical protein